MASSSLPPELEFGHRDKDKDKDKGLVMPRAVTYISTARFSREELDKIQLFETYYQSFLHPIQSVLEDVEETTYLTTERRDRSGIYVYFVGRANPPHDGHIEGLLMLCLYAIEHGGKAIILLGSGPNGGARTSKDPLDFDLKSKFIKDKLKDKNNISSK